MRRPSRSQLQRLVDYAIPLAVGALLIGVALDPTRVEPGPLKALGLTLAVVQGAALWWRRAYPERVMAITLAGGLGMQLIAPDGVLPFAGLVALGSLASLRPLRVSLAALVALLAVSAVNFFTTSVGDAGFALVVTVAAWAFGEIVRQRRLALEGVARRAAGDEQARIARELHDVLAHTVSVIVVQAGAANEIFDTRPEQARAALRSIEAAGREALQELRVLLAGVRSDPSVPPQPGLERLDELAEPLRAAGLDVAVRWDGADRTLPAGVGLSAYRIVQEALTNTLRHAHATRVQVTVRVEPDALELDVLDDGDGNGAAGGPGGGRGLAGMRERASILGGTFEAGPAHGGGYRVHARLPVEALP